MRGDLIIANVRNFSLIGTPNASNVSSPLSAIKCLAQSRIHFYNVLNLVIKDLMLKNCGGELAKYTDSETLHIDKNLWSSLFLYRCTNVEVVNVCIISPVGYGIIGINVMGNNSIKNTAIIMNQQQLLSYILYTCSYGVHWSYSEGLHTSYKNVSLYVMNIILNNEYDETGGCIRSQQDLFQIQLHQFSVYIIIKDSNFTNLKGDIFKFYVTSLSHNTIAFHRCNFIENVVSYAIDFHYMVPPLIATEYSPKVDIIFTTVKFSLNTYIPSFVYNSSILQFVASSLFLRINLNVVFDNVLFLQNKVTLLNVLSTTLQQINRHNVSIYTTTNFVVQDNRNFVCSNHLISLMVGQIYFNGVTKFLRNQATEILYSFSSQLQFSNSTLFIGNHCKYALLLDGQSTYIVLFKSALLKFKDNTVMEILKVSTSYNNPYPYCLFQYFSPIMSKSSFREFRVELEYFQIKKLEKEISDINKLTTHCKWIPGATFYNIDPVIVNRRIINFGHNVTLYQLGNHHTVCVCPPSSRYNCSVDQLGPVYPGENLTVDLCLPYSNEETGILYAETYNDKLPKSACKVRSYGSIKHTFYKEQSKLVHFTIATDLERLKGCELFLTAQPNLYTAYDVFYVHLLRCPLGFKLKHGICDCDPDLRKYIDDCIIRSQTVRQFSGVYIFGTTSDNLTNTYMVSTNCPIHFCLHGSTRINLRHPSEQCQPHRTGLLCSQCIKGYSLVYGSSRCKKCANIHLLFILFILFTGVFLVLFLLCLNLTVTTGTINGLVFYANMLHISSSFLHLQDRLIEPLYAFISFINLGSPFEMCLYNGMNMYAKIWTQFVFPVYLILIVALLIFGSRYSKRLYRLTYNRSLPVLATLLMLTYTTILLAISSAPLYTTIITIPGHSSKNAWLLDPTIPLFGWRFSILIFVCILVFFFMLVLNAILLFTKPLMRFKIIHQFKPLIDAFQGPFKSHCYYWVGVQLLIRNVMVLLSITNVTINIKASCIILVATAILHGYIRPYKKRLINIQELAFLFNYMVLYFLVLFNKNELSNVLTVNVLVGTSFFQFLLIIVYHAFAFVRPCKKALSTATVIWNFIRVNYTYNRRQVQPQESPGLEIPEVAFNFSNFREPLIGED